MNKWLKEKRPYILGLPILLFALLVSIYFFLLHPLATELARKEEQLANIEADIESLQAKLEQLTPDQFTEDALTSLISGVPNHPNIQNLIASIEQVEQRSGVVVDYVHFDLQESKRLEDIFPEHIMLLSTETEQELKDLHLSAVDIQIHFHGAQENMLQFIANLQKTARVIHVASTSFHQEQDGFTAKLTLTAYYSTDFNPYLHESSMLGSVALTW